MPLKYTVTNFDKSKVPLKMAVVLSFCGVFFLHLLGKLKDCNYSADLLRKKVLQ